MEHIIYIFVSFKEKKIFDVKYSSCVKILILPLSTKNTNTLSRGCFLHIFSRLYHIHLCLLECYLLSSCIFSLISSQLNCATNLYDYVGSRFLNKWYHRKNFATTMLGFGVCFVKH